MQNNQSSNNNSTDKEKKSMDPAEKYKGPETPFHSVTDISVKLSKERCKKILGVKNHDEWIDIFEDDFLEYLGFTGPNKRKHFNNRRHFWPHETEIIFKRFGVKIVEHKEE